MTDIFKRNSFWQKKKPFYQKPVFWIFPLAALIALFIVFTPSNDTITGNVVATPEKAPVETIELRADEPLLIEGVSYRVQKLDREAALSLGRSQGSKVFRADGVFFIVTFEILNTGTEAVPLTLPSMWLASSEGDFFAPRHEAEALYETSMHDGQLLDPGTPIRRIRIFDVSPGIEHLDVMFDLGAVRYLIPLTQ